MIAEIKDRYTEKTYSGPWVLADDYIAELENAPPCPECGADGGQQCSIPDGSETSQYVHAARVEYEAEEVRDGE